MHARRQHTTCLFHVSTKCFLKDTLHHPFLPSAACSNIMPHTRMAHAAALILLSHNGCSCHIRQLHSTALSFIIITYHQQGACPSMHSSTTPCFPQTLRLQLPGSSQHTLETAIYSTDSLLLIFQNFFQLSEYL